MDKRRIIARVSDTTTGEVLEERAYDLNLLFYKHRHVLETILNLYIDKLRKEDGHYELSLSCFKDIHREGRLPF